MNESTPYWKRHSNYSASGATAGTGAPKYSLSVRSGDPAMGEVSVVRITDPFPLSSESGNTVNPSPEFATGATGATGTRYRAKATAYKGYRFVKWESNLLAVGANTSNPFDFELTGDTVLVARFEKVEPIPDPNDVTATVRWNGDMGRVNGNGLKVANAAREGSGVVRAAQGSSITLTASPLAGYRFVQWHGGPVDGKASDTVSFQMLSNCAITAEFAAVDAPGSGGGGGGGTTTGGGSNTAAKGSAKESGVVAFVKKWWWALLVAAFIVYKEGGSR